MSTRAQKANKKRLAKQSTEIQGPRAEVQARPAPTPQQSNAIFDRALHPLVFAGLSIIAGIVGVISYTPVLVICLICILLAFYRSKALQGRGYLYQFNAYAIAVLLTAAVLLGAEAAARKPVRDYVRQIARDANAPPQAPIWSVKPPGPPPTPRSSPPKPLPMPGQLFHSFGLNQQAAAAPLNPNASPAANDLPRPDSPEGALMREMRQRLTRDAGNPDKVGVDVQWMRDQFEQGWQLEPPELAKKHEAETEETAKLILSAASNRRALLQLVPHITIDK
jgi:hypothetical protein